MKGKFNLFNFVALLIILSIFVISGAIFLTLLGFGLFGLSRLLIYFRLGMFTYNEGFYDNLIYYGSYIILGYFVIFGVEYLMDWLQKKLYPNPYLEGFTFHLISYAMMITMFYFVIHIHYQYIQIDYWVLMLIIAFLYICKEVFYPDAEDLNRK
ncbi:SepA family multidrug efflux transporter [Staphylococcus pseudintermedius]|uniref:SepA family multidrug efflux transporter n=1 Tax=Staphylococcus pseudintermedius TaxID=283734 RepID=UPI0001F6C488|nr:SepA family multidrug efflux transporter [Staphylococcus pseudintermedius]ADV06357.1 SmrB [Staphylococcus pseudintermedius HKU10-03]EGQ2823358.1 SepA family multidrug efflux transporter [Staphylococcus pseudintermedius]EJD8481453.1 SepA family multidrug efflux transporter [Staphylococcus pseudintermedius]EKH2174035.1 SepA family multidrug efflux transporter [Staphylococcus pseudintermedius]ELI4043181.1 SepA family multidrug efflux transporter [Staphylococcus pseudintermedius]